MLFTLAEDLTEMELHVDVDEADVGQVEEGQQASFTVDAFPDQVFKARITQVRYGAQEVEGVITYETVLQVDNSDLSLRPGMTATAEITVQYVKDALVVPNEALRFSPPAVQEDRRNFLEKLTRFGPPRLRKPSAKMPDGPNRKVWILADGLAKEVAVTVGPTDGRQTQILKGNLEPGQAVIVDTATSKK